MGDRVSKEDIEKANQVHILDYLNAKGEPIKKQGSKYYQHVEHDSLVFNENGKWYWNSRSVGGFGAISFAREFYNMKFQDAVRDVNSQNIEHNFSLKKEHEVKQEFVYPKEYEVESIDNALNYLSNERGIDKNIVLALKKRELIAEDKMKNIVFKWLDAEGNIVGADRQGTIKMNNKRGTFKQIMANSKEDGGFSLDIGKPNKIAFFESPIDALSYYDIKRPTNIRLKSMSGLKDQVVMTSVRELIRECHERNEQIDAIIFAVDNDKAGNDYARKWEHVLGEEILRYDFPKDKDWNNDLKNIRKKEKEKFSHKENELQERII